MIYTVSFDVEYLMFVSRAAFRETFNPASLFLLNVDQTILTLIFFFVWSSCYHHLLQVEKLCKLREKYHRKVHFNVEL